MRALLLLPLVSLIACGTSKEEFQDEGIRIACERMITCAEELGTTALYASAEECITDNTEPVGTDTGADACPNYDSSKASACLEAIEAMPCAPTEADITAIDQACDAVCPE